MDTDQSNDSVEIELEGMAGRWKSALFFSALGAGLFFWVRPPAESLLVGLVTGMTAGSVLCWRLSRASLGGGLLAGALGVLFVISAIWLTGWTFAQAFAAGVIAFAVYEWTLTALSGWTHRRLRQRLGVIIDILECAAERRKMNEGPPMTYPEQLSRWDRFCRKVPSKFRALFKDSLAPAVRLIDLSRIPRDNLDGKLPCSRVGGNPLVFGDFTWPERDGRPMNYVASLNLEHIAACMPECALPKNGLLLFFLDWAGFEWGATLSDMDSCRVLHLCGDVINLREITTPAGAETMTMREVAPWRGLSLNSKAIERAAANEEMNEEAVVEWLEQAEEEGAVWEPDLKHQCGGWPWNLHRDVHEKIASLEESSATAESSNSNSKYSPWLLLFQCDSDKEGWCWGDSSVLHFMIRRNDLEQGRFDRVLPSIN